MATTLVKGSRKSCPRAGKKVYMNKAKFVMGGRASFAAFAVVFAAVVAFALALPSTALASPDQQPKVSEPQSAWYNGQSHHFRSTVKDADGTELTEGVDFTRSFAFVSDRRSADNIPAADWKSTDDDMVSSGFVWERITYIGDYANWGKNNNNVRHNILTLYEFTEQNIEKTEGEADPELTATLNLFCGDQALENRISLSAFTLSREAGEQPGEYAISYTTDPEQLPALYKSNTAGTRFGYGSSVFPDGYTYECVVGDDICGFNYIKIIPGKLTIKPAYVTVSATVVWKDSSNKDGIRPSADDFAKLLSLTADGEASDVQPVVVDNGDDTYTVTYENLRKYAYSDEGERHEVAYEIAQASINDYSTENATVENGGTITNTHEVKATPESTDNDSAKSTTDGNGDVLAKTGDSALVYGVCAVAVAALVATAGAAALRRRFH